MPVNFARVLGVIAAGLMILAVVAPTAVNIEVAAWVALGVLGLLVATYPGGERTTVRTDGGGAAAEAIESLPREARGARARAAILSHLSERPVEAIAMVASFMRKGMPDESESARDAAPAFLAQRVRELTDGRAIELAQLLGLDITRRQEKAPAAM